MKRLLSLTLALLMCLSPCFVFAGCEKEPETPNGNKETEADPSTFVSDDLPELDFQNKTVNVLYWNDNTIFEFGDKDVQGDVLNGAALQRNQIVQDRLKVQLNFIGEPGNNAKRKSFYNRVLYASENSTHEFDIIAAYPRTHAMLYYADLLIDLKKITQTTDEQAPKSYLNFEKPWWASSDNSMLSWHFVSGDISPASFYNMTCVFFNKTQLNAKFNERAKAQGFESAVDMLWDAVYLNNKKNPDKNWTVDTLIELANAFCEGEENADKAITDARYGFVSIYYHLDGFHAGSNMLTSFSNQNSGKTVELVKKIGAWLKTDACLVESHGNELGLDQNDFNNAPGYSLPFLKQNALFMMCTAKTATTTLSKLESFDYGILPLPKYNDAQQNYQTCLTENNFSLYAIFADCIDAAGGESEQSEFPLLTAVLECMASESFRRLTPIVFSSLTGHNWADSPHEVAMFQYLHDSIKHDDGRILSDDLLSLGSMVGSAMAQNKDWITYSGNYRSGVQKRYQNMKIILLS